MRSPAFLEAMQRNLKAMTDLKAFQDQIVQNTARYIGLPLANVIYGLLNGCTASSTRSWPGSR